MRTPPFTVQLEPTIFLEICPIWYQFLPVFPQLTHILCMFASCLYWNLLLDTPLRACEMLPYFEHSGQETFVRIYGDTFCKISISQLRRAEKP